MKEFEDKFYGAIEYIENDPSKLMIPRWEANADNYPFTARGFTGSKNIVLPEFSYERGYTRAFQDGDILNIIDSETVTSLGGVSFKDAAHSSM
ncbi:hypothetical protein M2E15_4521 [Bacillus mycoides]|uniref:hypothetical protein n=1 Tax=Bacillus mycoides TaxID=1405 RepID=UPI00073E2B82|nr:hypothetical protein [Bacillus mycoides]KUH41006.1 hypothetical protein M2E15_4521 [Bacillus mycoides]